MIHLLNFKFKTKQLKRSNVLFNTLVTSDFKLRTRDIQLRIKDCSDPFKNHIIIYVFSKPTGRIVWGISLIQDTTIFNKDNNIEDLYKTALTTEFILYTFLIKHRKDISPLQLFELLSEYDQRSDFKFRPESLYEYSKQISFFQRHYKIPGKLYDYHMSLSKTYSKLNRASEPL